jgi:hypothetical protein
MMEPEPVEWVLSVKKSVRRRRRLAEKSLPFD